MKIFSLDLSRKVDRFKFIIILMGTGVFLVIITMVTYQKVNNPDFCIRCHVMLPEYYTWQASSHAKVKCTDCHYEAKLSQGMKGGTKSYSKENFKKTGKEVGLQHFAIIKNTYNYLTESFIFPIRMPLEIEDYTCLKCHSKEREVSATGDLIIPHSTHEKNDVPCVRCHSGVAHGGIASRAVTLNEEVSDWNISKGKENMQMQNMRTSMDYCMQCHTRREAPLKCSACHKNSKKPLSHNKKNFTQTHGKEALAELNACNLCHGYSGYANGMDQSSSVRIEEGLTSLLLAKSNRQRSQGEVIQYSRENMFCVNCHSKKPKSHSSPKFINYHSVEGTKKQSSCFTCHSNRPEEGNSVTKTTCASCHPSTHAIRNWRATHPIEVKGKVNESCIDCHARENCSVCHFELNK